MKKTQFIYNASMLPYFEEGKKQFTRETRISLQGLKWKIKDDNLIIEITEEQEEKWLFHLAFCIGVAYATSKTMQPESK